MPVTVRSFGKTTRAIYRALSFHPRLSRSQGLNLVENLPEISGNRSSVCRHIYAQDAGEVASEHGDSPSRSSWPSFMNLRIGITFSSWAGSIPRMYRRQTLVLEFDYDRALHERRRRDHVRCAVDFF